MNRIIDFLRQPIFESHTNRLRQKRRFLANRNVSLASKRRSLIHVLSIAMNEKLDPGLLIRNLADEYTGRYRRQLQRVASLVDAGKPVSVAIEQTPDVLTKPQWLTLKFAQETGTLPEAFRRLLSESREGIRDSVRRRSVFDAVLYAALVCVVMLKILTFLMVWIVPTFCKMAQDFGLEINGSLSWLISASNWFANWWWLPLLFCVLLLAFSQTLRVRAFLRRLPIVGWLSSNAGSRKAELLEMLAIACHCGRPIPAALSTLGRYHYDRATRHNVLQARNEVEQGEDVWKSLADADLISHGEAEGLAELADGPSQAWAMRHLAATKQQQSNRRSQSCYDLARPVSILVLAPIVAWIGYSVIGFLNHLVVSMS